MEFALGPSGVAGTDDRGISFSRNEAASSSLTFHLPFVADVDVDENVGFACPFGIPPLSPSLLAFPFPAVASPATPFLDADGPATSSILFPTTTTQKSSSSPSLTGALSLNSFHHFCSERRDAGDDTSYISMAAS